MACTTCSTSCGSTCYKDCDGCTGNGCVSDCGKACAGCTSCGTECTQGCAACSTSCGTACTKACGSCYTSCGTTCNKDCDTCTGNGCVSDCGKACAACNTACGTTCNQGCSVCTSCSNCSGDGCTDCSNCVENGCTSCTSCSGNGCTSCVDCSSNGCSSCTSCSGNGCSSCSSCSGLGCTSCGGTCSSTSKSRTITANSNGGTAKSGSEIISGDSASYQTGESGSTVYKILGYQTIYAETYTITFTANVSATISETSRTTHKMQPQQNRASLVSWTRSDNGGTVDPGTYIFPSVDTTVTANYSSTGSWVNDGDAYYEAIGDLPTATATGYKLTGWYVGSTQIDSTYTPTADTTVTAILVANQYTLTFDSNGGEDVPSITADYNTTVSLPSDTRTSSDTDTGTYTVTFSSEGSTYATKSASWSAPVSINYPFNGWVLGNVTYKAGYEYTVSRNTSFTASWGTAIRTQGTRSVKSVSAPTSPTKTGYSFKGWCDEDGNSVSFPFTPAGDTTLYATWTVNTYTITFKSDSSTTYTTVTGDYGSVLKWPSTPTRVDTGKDTGTYEVSFNGNGSDTTPETLSSDWYWSYKTTYNFTSWSCNGTSYKSTDTYIISGDATMLAQWGTSSKVHIESAPVAETITLPITTKNIGASQSGYYHITFSSIGSGCNEQTTPWSQKYTMTYSFQGWSDGTTTYDESYTPSKSITLNAVWGSYTTKYDEIVVDPITLPSSTLTGYTQTGWYYDDGEKAGDAGGSFTPTATPTNLTAQFKINQYTVTFYVDGNVYTTVTQNYNTNLVWPSNPEKTEAGKVETGSYTVDFSLTHGTCEDLNTRTAKYTHNYDSVYPFNYWVCGSKTYTAIDEYKIENDATMVGQWQEPYKQYTAAQVVDSVSIPTPDYIVKETDVEPDSAGTYVVSFSVPEKATSCDDENVHWKRTKIFTYDFTGWSDGESTYKNSYTPKDNTTLSDVWNGTPTITYTEKIIDSVELPSTSKLGYTFNGWYKESGLVNFAGNAGDSYTPETTRTLYANFTVNQYTITFTNTHDPTIDPITQDYETKLTWPDNPTWVVKNQIYKSTDNDSYTISFESNGGTVVKDEVATWTRPYNFVYKFQYWAGNEGTYTKDSDYTILDDDTMTAVWDDGSISWTDKPTIDTIQLTEITRDGWVFLGWYKEDGTYVGKSGSYAVNYSETLQAYWDKLYTLSYDSDGGEYDPPSEEHVKDDDFKTCAAILKKTETNVKGYEYTVTFDSQGGSACASQVATMYHNNMFEFNSWYGSNKTVYLAKKTYQMPGNDLLLTAQYTVTSVNEEYTDITSMPSPTLDGYAFAGWYDEPMGGNRIEAPYRPTEDCTLYAHWNGEYSLSYDANGGSTVPPTGYYVTGQQFDVADAIEREEEKQVTDYDYEVTFNSNGGSSIETQHSIRKSDKTYSFLRWIGSNNQEYTAGGVGIMPSYDLILKADWYVSSSNTNTTYVDVTQFTPTWENHTFVGWFDENGNQVTSTRYRPSGNVTLTAKWLEIYTYTVNYDANAGTETVSGMPDSTTLKTTDESATLSLSSTTPTRANYTFLGWVASAASTTTITEVRLSNTKKTTTVYAYWQHVACTLSFDANGKEATNMPEDITVNAASVTIPDTIPVNSTYEFVKWNTAQDGSGTSYVAGDTYSFGSKTSGTLYAIWKDGKVTYKVTYVVGIGDGPTYSEHLSYPGGKVELKLPPATTLKVNGIKYTFQGWGIAPGMAGKATSNWDDLGTFGPYVLAMTKEYYEAYNNYEITLYADWKIETSPNEFNWTSKDLSDLFYIFGVEWEDESFTPIPLENVGCTISCDNIIQVLDLNTKNKGYWIINTLDSNLQIDIDVICDFSYDGDTSSIEEKEGVYIAAILNNNNSIISNAVNIIDYPHTEGADANLLFFAIIIEKGVNTNQQFGFHIAINKFPSEKITDFDFDIIGYDADLNSGEQLSSTFKYYFHNITVTDHTTGAVYTDEDAIKIVTGQPVDNILATKWNKMRSYLIQLGEDSTSSSFPKEVSKGEIITAEQFNLMANAVARQDGAAISNQEYITTPRIPYDASTSKSSSPDKIKALFFEGNNSIKSIKDGLNNALKKKHT